MNFSPYDHLITHSNCMDGAGCALVFLQYGGTKKNIHFSNPAHESVDVLADKVQKSCSGRLYLADISVSLQMAESLQGKNVVLYDHHKSALPLSGFDWCHVDQNNSMCGSKLFHHALLPIARDRNLTELLEAIDDRDRWVNRNSYSTDLSDLFYLLGQPAFIERCRVFCSPRMREHEQYAVDVAQAQKWNYIEALRITEQKIDGHKIGFVYCEARYASDAGNHLCSKHDLDGCVLITPESVSLRAPTGTSLDMSMVAKRYGGGGHKCAAGFSLKALLEKPLMNIVLEKMELS